MHRRTNLSLMEKHIIVPCLAVPRQDRSHLPTSWLNALLSSQLRARPAGSPRTPVPCPQALLSLPFVLCRRHAGTLQCNDLHGDRRSFWSKWPATLLAYVVPQLVTYSFQYRQVKLINIPKLSLHRVVNTFFFQNPVCLSHLHLNSDVMFHGKYLIHI